MIVCIAEGRHFEGYGTATCFTFWSRHRRIYGHTQYRGPLTEHGALTKPLIPSDKKLWQRLADEHNKEMAAVGINLAKPRKSKSIRDKWRYKVFCAASNCHPIDRCRFAPLYSRVLNLRSFRHMYVNLGQRLIGKRWPIFCRPTFGRRFPAKRNTITGRQRSTRGYVSKDQHHQFRP